MKWLRNSVRSDMGLNILITFSLYIKLHILLWNTSRSVFMVCVAQKSNCCAAEVYWGTFETSSSVTHFRTCEAAFAPGLVTCALFDILNDSGLNFSRMQNIEMQMQDSEVENGNSIVRYT